MRPPRPSLPRPSGSRAGRAHLRLVVPVDDPAPTANPFVENDPAMPTVNLSTDTPMTFAFRGITVPTVEALCAELSARRAAGEHANPEVFDYDPTEMHYGRPQVLITGTFPVEHRGRVVNADEATAASYTWDHTVWSLIEAAEIARGYEGAVYVTQAVHTTTSGAEDAEEVESDETIWVDEGFEVLVADFRPAYMRDETLTATQRAAAYIAAHPDAEGDEA